MQEEGLDLRQYWHVLRRRWWLFILAGLVGALFVFLFSSSPVPLYEATTKVMTEGGRGGSGGTSVGDIDSSRTFAAFYDDLI